MSKKPAKKQTILLIEFYYPEEGSTQPMVHTEWNPATESALDLMASSVWFFAQYISRDQKIDRPVKFILAAFCRYFLKEYEIQMKKLTK